TEHWNGATWTVVPSPNPPDVYYTRLIGVSAGAADDVWAVGFHVDEDDTYNALAEHWDGAAWAIIPTAAEALGASETYGVASLPPAAGGDVWAVGEDLPDRFYSTLTMRYHNQCATPASTVTGTSTPASTPSPRVSATPTTTFSPTATGVRPTSTPTATAPINATNTPTRESTATATPVRSASVTPAVTATPTIATTPCRAPFSDIQPSD